MEAYRQTSLPLCTKKWLQFVQNTQLNELFQVSIEEKEDGWNGTQEWGCGIKMRSQGDRLERSKKQRRSLAGKAGSCNRIEMGKETVGSLHQLPKRPLFCGHCPHQMGRLFRVEKKPNILDIN